MLRAEPDPILPKAVDGAFGALDGFVDSRTEPLSRVLGVVEAIAWDVACVFERLGPFLCRVFDPVADPAGRPRSAA